MNPGSLNPNYFRRRTVDNGLPEGNPVLQRDGVPPSPADGGLELPRPPSGWHVPGGEPDQAGGQNTSYARLRTALAQIYRDVQCNPQAVALGCAMVGSALGAGRADLACRLAVSAVGYAAGTVARYYRAPSDAQDRGTPGNADAGNLHF